MYVRRTAIDAIGKFDLAFGAGYGEENDFCLRAARLGWRNVLADDAFVVHTGGRSFEGRKDELGGRNLAHIRARHPHYEEMVERYIAADPLRALREAAQSRLFAGEHTPGVLHVIHHHGGGTETHVRALIAASRDRWRHYLAVTIGDRWHVEEHRADGSVVKFSFARQEGEPWADYVAGLLGTFNIGLVHLHNISGCREGLIEALAHVDVPFGYTLHDLNSACPTITFLDAEGRYCGGVTDPRVCQECVAAQPAFAGIDVTSWREMHAELVERAAFILAPSEWASSMFRRYFRRDYVAVIPHGMTASPSTATPGLRLAALMPEDDMPVVAVLGAIGPDKGARRVEQIVELLRAQQVALRIVVIGYLDVQRGPWQSEDGRLTVHGRYDARDLPALLRHYKARYVLFPSAGPETFSYTLSESWRAGMPVLVPPIGALAERVAATGAGWVLTGEEWADESRMLARVVTLAGADAMESRASAAAKARAVVHASTQAMADATLEHYNAALQSRATVATFDRFANARVRDALGYEPWRAPAPAAEASSSDEVTIETDAPGAEEATLVTRFARRALAIRRTPMGRLLYRMTPTPFITALKARLDA